MDVHEPEVRSYNMSQIKGKDTKPELLVRKFLYSKGFRYRLHAKNLPGKPDIVLPKFNTVIQVHGCFWHCHQGCKYFVIPKTRTEWWKEKLFGNKARDEEYQNQLRELGLKVRVVWECELKKSRREKTLLNLLLQLQD